jgi:hypothetical protein
MNFLAKLFGARTGAELAGISLNSDPLWEVSNLKIASTFFRYLELLMPEKAIICCEGASAEAIISYLQSNPALESAHVRGGTVWPRPHFFHIPVEAAQGLAELAEKHASFEICIHLHVYKGGVVLLEWFDAWSDPFYLANEIAENKIAKFCDLTGGKYKKITKSER